jgi:hypothetical protein
LLFPIAFNQIKADYPDRSFARALKEEKITERDNMLIRSFIAELQFFRNTSTKRAYKITYALIDASSARSKNDMAALYAGIAALKSDRSKRGRDPEAHQAANLPTLPDNSPHQRERIEERDQADEVGQPHD